MSEMHFYIKAEDDMAVRSYVDKMSKHLTTPPNVIISEPRRELIKRSYACDGELYCDKYYMDVREVHIEELEMSDWVLVAEVYYRDKVMVKVSSKYYKDIPSQYGLDYNKCDYCGGTRERIESSILYNPKEDKWMQVGSTCVNKMIDNYKYLVKFMVELHKYLGNIGCGDGEDLGGWGYRMKTLHPAYKVSKALTCILEYQKEFGETWRKSEYDRINRCWIGGTNKDLSYYITTKPFAEDEDLYNKVWNVIKQNEGGFAIDSWTGQQSEERDFDGKMYDAFKDEYVSDTELYLVWFAYNKYKESLTESFTKVVEKYGYVPDCKATIVAKLVETNVNRDYYGMTYEFWLEDANGIKITKTGSRQDLLEEFKQADGTYKFVSPVKFVSEKKKYIGLGGRLSKAKA